MVQASACLRLCAVLRIVLTVFVALWSDSVARGVLGSESTIYSRFPRVELHVHLDGSVNVDTLYRICRSRKLVLPGTSSVPRSARDLETYLARVLPTWHRFDIVNDIIGGDAPTIRAVAEAFVGFQAKSGVAYTEVRYDPTRLARSAFTNSTLTEEETVKAVEEGLALGAKKYGVSAYQLLCAMRGQSSQKCMDLVELAAHMRSTRMGAVVGVDLAGDESSFPNGPYVDCLRRAKVSFGLNTTVHCGEFPDTSASEVGTAVQDMQADRIGHGYQALKDPAVVSLLRERRIHIEACPASATHHGLLEAVGQFKVQKLNFGLNTDDSASFFNNVSLPAIDDVVKTKLGFTDADTVKAYAHARAAAFGPASALLPSLDELFIV